MTGSVIPSLSSYQAKPVLAAFLVTMLSATVLPAFSRDTSDHGASTARSHGPAIASSSHRTKPSLFDQLGLSDEQKQSMHEIRETNRAKAKAIRDQLQTRRKELRSLMTSPDSDKSQAVTLQREITVLQSQMEELRLKTWFAMKEKMTPEQLAKLKQMRQAARLRRERAQKQQQNTDSTAGTHSER